MVMNLILTKHTESPNASDNELFQSRLLVTIASYEEAFHQH